MECYLVELMCFSLCAYVKKARFNRSTLNSGNNIPASFETINLSLLFCWYWKDILLAAYCFSCCKCTYFQKTWTHVGTNKEEKFGHSLFGQKRNRGILGWKQTFKFCRVLNCTVWEELRVEFMGQCQKSRHQKTQY